MSVALPPLWPAALPMWPVPSSVSVVRQPSRISFSPQRGLPIERPASTAALLFMDLRLPPTTRAAGAAFWAFYEDDIKGGALRFGWVHPLRETVREVTIIEGEGSPVETDIDATYSQLSMRIAFLDVLPGWADQVTTVNGFMEAVTP